LETLRKIGKTILLSSDTLGHEVRRRFQGHSQLEDAMLEIMENFRDGECQKMCGTNDGRSTFLDRLVELNSLTGVYGVFEGLEEVVAQMSRVHEDEEDDNGCRPWGLPHGPVLFAPGSTACFLSPTSPLGLVRAPSST
jgi:hypothetical protein